MGKMLNKWAVAFDDRCIITEYLDWLDDNHPNLERHEMNHNKLLNEFHGIDAKALEKERRALLGNTRKSLAKIEKLRTAMGCKGK